LNSLKYSKPPIWVWLASAFFAILAALAVGRIGWAFILLDPSLVHPDPIRGLRMPYLLLVPIIGLVPLWWHLLNQLKMRSMALAGVLGLVVFLACEVSLRQPASLEALFMATRARAHSEDGDWVLRSGSLLRLGVLGDRAEDRTRLIAVGTSLIYNGIDYDLLQQELPDFKVCRRAMAGMFPLRMLAAQNYLSIRSDDVVVFFLTDFDLGETIGLDPSWMRLVSSRAGVRDVERLLTENHIQANWKDRVDVRLAALSELWRCREPLNMILLNPLGKPPRFQHQLQTADLVKEDGWRAWYQHISIQNPAWQLQLQALEMVFNKVVFKGAHFVVFEGRVSPAFKSSEIIERQFMARVAIRSLVAKQGGTFIDVDQQAVIFADTDFSDGVHMTADAARRFTRYLADWMKSNDPSGTAITTIAGIF
jgi:hypothetical protein